MARSFWLELMLTAGVVVLFAGCGGDRAREQAKDEATGVDQTADKDAGRPVVREPVPNDRSAADKPAAPRDAQHGDDGAPFNGKPLRAWVSQLQNQNGDVKARVQAAEALGEFFGKGGALVGKGEVRQDADLTLQALGQALLKDKSPRVHQAALSALGRANTLAIPVLTQVVKSGSKEVRRAAGPNLCRLIQNYGAGRDTRKAVPVLAELLQEEDEALRCDAVRALQRIPGEAGVALPALLTASKADDDGGKAAREALAAFRRVPRSVAPALVPFLKDPEPHVRLKAVEVLCDLEESDKECLACLLELVRRRDTTIRSGAATLLARYGSAAKDAVPALIEIARNDPIACSTAINALGAIGPDAKTAVPALKAVAKSNKQLEATVQAALKKIEQ